MQLFRVVDCSVLQYYVCVPVGRGETVAGGGSVCGPSGLTCKQDDGDDDKSEIAMQQQDAK